MNEITNPSHLNRPYTIESIFYMWRLTGNREWQERGWKLFTKWAEASITDVGFAELQDVTEEITDDGNKYDGYTGNLSTESLKYFFLLFSDPATLSLDEYVFSVAAHPFKIPGTPTSPGVTNWQDPQDSQVSFLNPPTENAGHIQNTPAGSPLGGTGTYLQQWSRTTNVPQSSVSQAASRSR